MTKLGPHESEPVDTTNSYGRSCILFLDPIKSASIVVEFVEFMINLVV